MSITFVSTDKDGKNPFNDANPLVIPAPAGIQDDDILIAFIARNSAFGTLTPPSGFTQVEGNDEGGYAIAVFYKIASSESGSYTFTETDTSTNPGVGHIGVFRGVDTSTPFDVTYSAGSHKSSTAGDTTPACSTITTATNGAMVVTALWIDPNGTWYTATEPTSYTKMSANHNSNYTVGIDSAYYEVATAGLHDPGDWSHNESGSTLETTLVLALQPAGAGDVTAPVLSSPTASSTGQTTGSGGVTTDEGNGTLYFYVSTSATPPSSTDLKAGTGAVDSGSQAVSGTGVQSVSGGFSGLSAATTYYAHYLHTDAAANDSSISTSASFTTDASDVTAPALATAAIPSAGTTIVLTYDEALDTGSVPTIGDFSIATDTNHGAIAVDTGGVAVAGSAVTLTLDRTIDITETITVSYTAGVNPIQDVATNAAANLSGQATTNNSTQIISPNNPGNEDTVTLADAETGSDSVWQYVLEIAASGDYGAFPSSYAGGTITAETSVGGNLTGRFSVSAGDGNGSFTVDYYDASAGSWDSIVVTTVDGSIGSNNNVRGLSLGLGLGL